MNEQQIQALLSILLGDPKERRAKNIAQRMSLITATRKVIKEQVGIEPTISDEDLIKFTDDVSFLINTFFEDALGDPKQLSDAGSNGAMKMLMLSAMMESATNAIREAGASAISIESVRNKRANKA